MKTINLKFCAPFRFYTEKFRKIGFFYFSLLYPRKNGLRRKSKVYPLDTQIK